MSRLRALIRDVPDFPEAGVLFRDITPLLGDAWGLRAAVDALAAPFAESGVDLVAGIEARGFLLGPAVATRLGVGFVPMRKEGRLPRETVREEYQLEYGRAVIEVHEDALRAGDGVLVLDDVLATGGTARAACRLVEALGGRIAGLSFLVELQPLGGRKGLEAYRIESAVQFGEEG
ncbi:MAG: adenine phosphoribosyltransferase [Gemmatimonadaceae bacterium]|nr:adenine phosphoribosyltransferase [Gemmatimonadaceae bacterium]